MADFNDNIVNQQFKKVYKYLTEKNLIKGKSDLATQLGTYNHVINAILKGTRNITIDQLNKLFDTFSINANYLFGLSPMMTIGDDMPTYEGTGSQSGGNIRLLPHKALAGNSLLQEPATAVKERFKIPGMDGDLVAIEIEGDSMSPTLTSGDIVVCERIERGQPLRDNAVYVIVTDVVVAKRVQQIKNNNQLVSLNLISDNSDTYKPYEVDLEEIREIYMVRCRVTNYKMN